MFYVLDYRAIFQINHLPVGNDLGILLKNASELW